MKRAGAYWVPDHETHLVPHLEQGVWQGDHLEAALAHVTNWNVAVDGGAHVGSWSLEMAKRFGSVVAFEPAPDTYACLVANIEGVANIKPRNRALGETAGMMGMGEDEKYHGGNTGGRFVTGEGDVVVIPLDVCGLEDVGFIKLDVEGFELFALKGARRTIARCRPIILIEDKPRMAYRHNILPGAAPRYLTELGMIELARVGADRVFGWP